MSGLINIQPYNKMTVTYSIIGNDIDEVLSEITPRAVEGESLLSEIVSRAKDEDKILSILDIKKKEENLLESLIDVKENDKIYSEIEVRPHNKMQATYEIIHPPILRENVLPTKDSYVVNHNEYNTVNFGNTATMLVGNQGNNEYISYIQFDLNNFNRQNYIINAKFRVYYNGHVPDNLGIEISTLNKEWYEYGITYANKPSSVDLITNKHYHDKQGHYIEFDFTEITKNWLKNPNTNNGVAIKLNKELKDIILYLNSKESKLKPSLNIEYFDTRIYSASRSQVESEVFIYGRGRKDLTSEIVVASTLSDSLLDSEIYVHKYEYPLFEDLGSEVVVSKPILASEIIVAHKNEDEILSEIIISKRLNREIDSEIDITRPFLTSEIYIPFWENINSEIIVPSLENSQMDSSLMVTRPELNSEIVIASSKDSTLYSEITISVHNDNVIESSIEVTRPELNSEIVIKVANEQHLTSEIVIVGVGSNTIDSEIYVTRNYLHSEIEALPVSKIESEIWITRPRLNSEIIVPYWDEKFIESHINIRAIRVNDLYSEIVIYKDNNNSYWYII